MRQLIFAGVFSLTAASAFAQGIAPTRTFGGPAAPMPNPGAYPNQNPPTVVQPTRTPGEASVVAGMARPPKVQYGYQPDAQAQALTLTPPPIQRAKKAVDADTTLAEPLTLSEPGRGPMSDFYDPSPNAPQQSLPGQKREIMRDQ